jgi:ribosomal protein S8
MINEQFHLNCVISSLKAAIKTNKKTVIIKVTLFTELVLKKLCDDGILLGYKRILGFGINLNKSRHYALVCLPTDVVLRHLVLNFICFKVSKKLLSNSSYLPWQNLKKYITSSDTYLLVSSSRGLLSNFDLFRFKIGGLVIISSS